MKIEHTDYGWKDPGRTCSHEYILPAVMKQIQDLYHGKWVNIIDIGCGNGYAASKLAELGHSVLAVDVSPDGIEIARSTYPQVQFKVCSIYDDRLANVVGKGVDCVIALELVEHLFYPKKLFEQSFQLLRMGGYLIISTPYHGFLKNLAISLIDGWDRYFRVEWDGGHIKFFSIRTLAQMACNAGFRNPHFHGVGRLPWLWKSMIMVVEK